VTDALVLAERVAELVRIPSVNPLQCSDSAITGERRLAEHLADRAEALGAEVTLDVVEDDRPNLYARFAGDSDEVLVVDVHLDTVAVDHMTVDPFDGRIDDGRVYGRGSVDTKATFALVLSVLEELRAAGRRPRPTVYLVGTIAEELGGLTGARRFADWVRERDLRIDRMVVGEPTVCAPVHGHKGALGVEFSVHGHAAHSGYPELGRNAVSAAARIVMELDAEQARLAATPAATAVGCGTLSVTEIRGGLARNIVPDRCDVFVGRRLVPGEDPHEVFHQLTALAAGVVAPCSVESRIADGLAFPAFYTPADDALIAQITALSGEQPATAGYGTNCMAYGALAASTVVFGPGSIDQAHQAVEWVDIAELVRATDIYRQLLTSQ
jgi:acetylornithine deacetylase/succinyl-diaminopimelate desuccinylase-like protein